MSNQVDVRVVRGIFMKKVDVCATYFLTKGNITNQMLSISNTHISFPVRS